MFSCGSSPGVDSPNEERREVKSEAGAQSFQSGIPSLRDVIPITPYSSRFVIQIPVVFLYSSDTCFFSLNIFSLNIFLLHNPIHTEVARTPC
jgi:hypothetical protein